MLHAPNRFIRRKVLAIVDEDAAYAAESLAREIFPGDERLTRAQLNAVRRAMHALVRKYPGELVLTGGKGREPLWIGTYPAIVDHLAIIDHLSTCLKRRRFDAR